MDQKEIVQKLRDLGSTQFRNGMERFAVFSGASLGVSMPLVRALAKTVDRDHNLAKELWDSGIYEARVLATLIDDPAMVSEDQMEAWAKDFDSWGIVDNTCGNLFDKTPFAYQKAREWSKRNEEFVKRAGFVLIAYLAVHDKKASDKQLFSFFPLINEASSDERNFVKKSVNWALREIGKRNVACNNQAIVFAKELEQSASPSARWIAKDALRELQSKAVRSRLTKKSPVKGFS